MPCSADFYMVYYRFTKVYHINVAYMNAIIKIKPPYRGQYIYYATNGFEASRLLFSVVNDKHTSQNFKEESKLKEI